MIRVLLVDDSATFRAALTSVLATHPDFEVLGAAYDGCDALDMVIRLRPDLVLMDVVMPRLDGISATVQIMRVAPCPVVVLSSQLKADEQKIVFDALNAGAVEVLPKPVSLAQKDVQDRFVRALKAMAGVKVVRRKAAGTADMLPAGPREMRFVAMGASTGGPPALSAVLKALTPGFPVPIVIAQHLAQGFAAGFGRWLAEVTGFAVQRVEEPVAPLPGHLYLAADGHHVILEGEKLRPLPAGSPSLLAVPSVDVLFESLLPWAPSVLAVVLTGMGADGSQGLIKLRSHGAYTLVQDEATSLVYGMPRAAKELGAASEELPLGRIGPRILQLQGAGRKDP